MTKLPILPLVILIVATGVVGFLLGGLISPGWGNGVPLWGVLGLASAIGIWGWTWRTLWRAPSGEVQRQERWHDEVFALRDRLERGERLLAATGSFVIRRKATGATVVVRGDLADDLVQAAVSTLGSESTVQQDHDSTGLVAVPLGARTVWFAMRAIPGLDDATGEPCVDLVLTDVSAQIDREAQLIRSRDHAVAAEVTQSRILSATSHELRTPLHGIVGLSSLLEQTALTGEQRSYLAGIRTSADALLGLVNAVLDATRRDQSPANEPGVRIADLVQGLLELMAPDAYRKGLDLALDVDADVPDIIELPVGPVRQIVLNLIGNAIKFTGRGHVVVRIGLSRSPSALDATDLGLAARLVIDVEDTGRGIPTGALDRIFERFTRAPNLTPTDTVAEGTGLGLPIARDLARELGGDIRVRSTPGNGSRFTVEIPIPSAEPLLNSKDDHSAEAIAAHRSKSVILLTDESVTLDVMARQITSFGSSVSTQPDVPGVLADLDRLSADHEPLVILADVGTLSADTVDRIARHPARPRVVALMWPQERPQIEALRSSGLSGYLVRPVRRSSLERILAGPAAPAAAGIERSGWHPAARPDAPSHEPGFSDRALTILLADDNPINRLLARSMIVADGHRIHDVVHGGLAIESVRTAAEAGHWFDLVLLDLHMPIVDGFEAARQIRAIEAQISHRHRLPIWAVTADVTEEAADEARRAGIDRLILKPFDIELLRADLAGLAKATALVAAREDCLTAQPTNGEDFHHPTSNGADRAA